eukprot:s972_g27.t1
MDTHTHTNSIGVLDTKRKTIMEFHKGKTDVKGDDWCSGELPASKSTESCRGEQEQPEALHTERHRMIRIFETSILLFRVALPLPGQEVSRASPQYQRMFEKLNNDVEWYKLHVKHYHMISAQFRRRTSMLGLPGEIYDKYDRIVKGCRVCSTQCQRLREPESQGYEHRHSAI